MCEHESALKRYFICQAKYPNIRRGHHDSGGGADGDFAGGRSGTGGSQEDRESSAMAAVSKIYKKVAIKLSKLGSDDFDFDRYNRYTL